MDKRIKIRIILPLTIISILWLSCKKNEEPPIPIGQPIKYNGQLMGSIDSALQKSPYTLFYAAWIKSGIDNIAVNAAALTVYVPTDSAMTAAGYTAAKISTMDKDDLDSLVAFHAVYGTYTDTTLKSLPGSTAATTLLNTATIAMSYTSYQDFSTQYPYMYTLFLSGDNGFWIDGLSVKTSSRNFYAYRTTLYPISKVLPRPAQDAAAFIASDPRFTYLMESMRVSDSIYYQTYNHNPNYDATADIDRLALSAEYTNLTYFAPTNTAFVNFLAGVYHKPTSAVTFQDLDNYQNRVVEGFFSGESSPIDSIIDVYYIQTNQRNNESYEYPNRPPVTGLTLLYNDLLYNGQILSGYTPPSGLNNAFTGYYYINLDFVNTSSTKVMLKRHSNSLPPSVNITQADIMVTNGVVHAVDGLLAP
jgi:uncharacterized surface protein with fasciclin (FAS1) repeats